MELMLAGEVRLLDIMLLWLVRLAVLSYLSKDIRGAERWHVQN